MIVQGFCFGMTLQFAIGPVCLFVFQSASLSGFVAATGGVLGVALVDGVYMILAGLGVGSLLKQNQNLAKILQMAGALILLFFGLRMTQSLWQFQPQNSETLSTTDFLTILGQSVLLTISNPMTLLFWSGVFAARISREKMHVKELCLFGMGCLMATLTFLSVVAGLGHLFERLAIPWIIQGLNGAVGFFLVFISLRTLWREFA